MEFHGMKVLKGIRKHFFGIFDPVFNKKRKQIKGAVS